MSDRPKKPVPLDYATPGGIARPARRKPDDDGPQTAPPFERPVAVLQSDVHADIEFAVRALRGKGIRFAVAAKAHDRVYAKRVETLVVDAADEAAARSLVEQLLKRRGRLAKLPRQDPDLLAPGYDGVIWWYGTGFW
jgi:hypothetical protein